MSRQLEALMLQHNFFAFYKGDPTSNHLLNQIVDDFRPYFVPPLQPCDVDPLMEKIKNKITRVRSELLRRGTLLKTDTGFITAADTPVPTAQAGSRPSGDSEASGSSSQYDVHRGQLKEWIQHHHPGLLSADSDYAIDAFILLIEHLQHRTSCT
jgi:hypothetical protein